MEHIGLFAAALKDEDLRGLPTLAAADDASHTLEDRARSYSTPTVRNATVPVARWQTSMRGIQRRWRNRV